ncbi:ABC transporter ATP-binding protein [Streptococcus dentapri]|uniref:ABC transporter ATP-binding protein n=1 Tax=Streptococcus dentapri TaxID=573564 RepID=A0ABV8CZR3_9STRE
MILEFLNVSKVIDDRKIINNISFEVAEGSNFALLGPNGAGKTTIVRLLMGLLKPTQGQIKLLGQDVNEIDSSSLRQNIGVQNDGNLYEKLTVRENLNIWGSIYDMTKEDCDKRVTELLSQFHLEERADSKVGTLSKGMKQKVSLIRAILHRPKLLVLDEPTSGLDPESIESFNDYLKFLVQNNALTVLMCTHQLQGLELLADSVGIIKQGELLVSGKADEIIANTWKTAEFDIKTDDNQRSLAVCQYYGSSKIILNDEMEQIVRVQLSKTDDISCVIRELIDNELNIHEVIKQKHQIKELYFKVIGADIYDKF